MRKFYFVTITTKDGKEYFYDIYIRGIAAAITEAKKQLFDRYSLTNDDVLSCFAYRQ